MSEFINQVLENEEAAIDVMSEEVLDLFVEVKLARSEIDELNSKLIEIERRLRE